LELLNKVICFEDAVVGVVAINGHTVLCAFAFKRLLGPNGVGSIEHDLVSNANFARRMIAEHGTATVSLVLCFLSRSVR